ncbi:MAG: helix-turn-helix domain-containing protein [Coriobacteriales bacterium]|jgi:excisionase family DNA binding protein|nr:helix-turn-helix domain-containing protein [Coriobacteriales bacterium]
MRAAKGCGVSARQDQTLRNVPTEEHDSILSSYPPALTTEQTAEILAVSPARVRELLRRGEIPGIHLGNIWRISRARLEALLLGSEQ